MIEYGLVILISRVSHPRSRNIVYHRGAINSRRIGGTGKYPCGRLLLGISKIEKRLLSRRRRFEIVDQLRDHRRAICPADRFCVTLEFINIRRTVRVLIRGVRHGGFDPIPQTLHFRRFLLIHLRTGLRRLQAGLSRL
jgi:hypothetical protein